MIFMCIVSSICLSIAAALVAGPVVGVLTAISLLGFVWALGICLTRHRDYLIVINNNLLEEMRDMRKQA